MVEERRNILILTGILIVAAVLRLGWPGISELKFDEAVVARSALSLVRMGVVPKGFISSIPGVSQPPLMAYLLAPPFLISRNPAVAVLFLGLLGVVSVFLAYRLGSLYFDTRVGLLTAAFFAVAPWPIFYDRKLWAQNLPLLTIVMMISLHAVIVRRRSRAILWVLLSLGVLVGLYLGNAVLAGVVVLGLLLYPRSIAKGNLRVLLLWSLLGLGLAAVVLGPYLFNTLPTLLGSISGGTASSGGLNLQIMERVDRASRVATGFQFHALAGDRFQEFYETLPVPDYTILDAVAMWLMWAGGGYVIGRSVAEAIVAAVSGDDPEEDATISAKNRRTPQSYTLLTLWIVVPLVVWGLSGLDPQPHRYIMMYPAQHMLMSVLIIDAGDWLIQRQSRLKPILVGILVAWVVVLGAWQITEYVGLLRFVGSGGQISGGHGAPIRDAWMAAREARDFSDGGRNPVVIYSGGDDPDNEGDAALWDILLGDLNLYLVAGDGVTVLPANEEYVWLEGYQDGQYEVEQQVTPEFEFDAPIARLVNGVDLMDVELSSGIVTPGETQHITLTWRVWGIPPVGDDYSYTVQLFTEEGFRWAQVDGRFLRTEFWQPEDVIQTTVDLAVDAEAPEDGFYQLVAAMYVYQAEGQGEGVEVLDPAGNPAGQFIINPLNQFTE